MKNLAITILIIFSATISIMYYFREPSRPSPEALEGFVESYMDGVIDKMHQQKKTGQRMGSSLVGEKGPRIDTFFVDYVKESIDSTELGFAFMDITLSEAMLVIETQSELSEEWSPEKINQKLDQAYSERFPNGFSPVKWGNFEHYELRDEWFRAMQSVWYEFSNDHWVEAGRLYRKILSIRNGKEEIKSIDRDQYNLRQELGVEKDQRVYEKNIMLYANTLKLKMELESNYSKEGERRFLSYIQTIKRMY